MVLHLHIAWFYLLQTLLIIIIIHYILPTYSTYEYNCAYSVYSTGYGPTLVTSYGTSTLYHGGGRPVLPPETVAVACYCTVC